MTEDYKVPDKMVGFSEYLLLFNEPNATICPGFIVILFKQYLHKCTGYKWSLATVSHVFIFPFLFVKPLPKHEVEKEIALP